MDHDRLYITVLLKTKFKRHLPREFHDCSWVSWSWHCSHKGTRRTEERKKKKKAKMTKPDFHHFLVRHFSNKFEQSPCYCKKGQRQRVDLSVFGYINSPPGEISAASILFFCSSLHREALPCVPNIRQIVLHQLNYICNKYDVASNNTNKLFTLLFSS